MNTPFNASPLPGMSYRSDIDGLSFWTVAPVALFHSGIGLLPGGLVGVLAATGRFNIAGFYERRCLRILPALIPVFLLSLIVEGDRGYFLEQFSGLASTIICTAGFASNFYLRNVSGYFDTPIACNPLSHPWSLAVEEQFYIVIPLISLITYRYFSKKLVHIYGVILLLSAV